MAGIHCLQHIKRLLTSAFAKDNSVGTHAKRVSDKFPLADFAFTLKVRWARLQPNDVRLLKLKLGGILNSNKSLTRRNRA
jgi:hypothetical protein